MGTGGGIYFRGTGEQRPNLRGTAEQRKYWVTVNIENIFCVGGGTREQANYFRETREQVPPPPPLGGPHKSPFACTDN